MIGRRFARYTRMTIRQLMVVVLIVAVVVGIGEGLWRRHLGFLRLAAQHEQSGVGYSTNAHEWKFAFDLVRAGDKFVHEQTSPAPPTGLPSNSNPDAFELEWLDRAQGFARLASYHAGLGRKYRYASAHPWLPVARDPVPLQEPEAVPDQDGDNLLPLIPSPETEVSEQGAVIVPLPIP